MAMRFGLYDGNPHTLDQIGRALGLTRERIRQLEKKSLSMLRHPSRAQPLLGYVS
jgi:RNA polymerase primary sigma factor